MNTVLAGLLTFLKGSGLPNRLKYYHSEWSKVREYIEQRERDFSKEHHGLKMHEELTVIQSMYESVRKDIEANTPDSFISMSNANRNGGVAPASSLAKQYDARLSSMDIDKLQGYPQALEERLKSQEDRFSLAAEARLRETEGKIAEATGRIEKVPQLVEERLRSEEVLVEKRLRREEELAVRTAENAAQRTVAKTQAQLSDRSHKVEGMVMSAAEKAAEKVLHMRKHSE